METITLHKDPMSLQQAWEGIENAKPGIRIREAAKALDVSEAQLLATKIGQNCIRLKRDWQSLMKQLPKLGYVMSLTRNDVCILENKGSFQKVNTFGTGDHAMGTVIGPIESRIFFKNWHVAFAVQQEKNGRELKSLQVFDKAGEAITKIYLQEKSDEAAYWKLIDEFRSEDQNPGQDVVPYMAAEFNQEVDQNSFLADWDGMNDTHDFFPMLRKHNVNRYHALELATEKYTYQIPREAVQQILETAAKTKLPIMIFAGNKGNLQIHQGKVRTIRLLERGHTGKERWLNVLDPEFNMHLRLDLVATVWVVKKPTADGIITAVELFDAEKNLVAQFFGLRKPGIPQRKEWSSLVASIGKL